MQLNVTYEILFFCCTKEVHLGVVSDLTIFAFIGALREFIATRGNFSNIYSDKATNFRGGWMDEWNFIPPHSFNFGGRGNSFTYIRRTKYHCKSK